MAKVNPFAGTRSLSMQEIAPIKPMFSGYGVLAELNSTPESLRKKHTTITGQIDALERKLDYLEGRLENAQKTGNQTVYNAVLKQYQDMANRVQSLATEANSIGDSIRYQADYTNRQQKITDSKPKTTMDKVRESLPYALGSGIRDMIVDTGKGLGQTALYAENAIRGSTLGKNDKGFATLQLGKAGTQLNPNTMQMEDITMGDVADTYIKEGAKTAGTYVDALNSLGYLMATGRYFSKPDSEDERFRKMFSKVPRIFGTKDIQDPTVAKGAEVIADPLAVFGGAVKGGKAIAKSIDEFGDIAKGFRRGDGQYIPRDQLGAIENLWHGTPHEFDRFDLSKIGTGEGAQAYGHGAYLAESPNVAKEYAVTLSNRNIGNQGRLNAHANAKRLVKISGDNPENAIDDIKFVLETNPDHDQKELLTNTLRYLESGDYAKPLDNSGNIYKTRLAWDDAREAVDPLTPDHFLHWDKPLSEQSPSVVDKLVAMGYADRSDALSMDTTGERLYQELSEYAKNGWYGLEGQSGIANKLSENGIAGIRYLDQGSRGTANGTLLGIINDGGKFKSRIKVSNRGGAHFQSPTDIITTSPPFNTELEAMEWANNKIQEGSHNYVVFDDKLIDIVERNGVPIKKAKK